jgi:alkylation response protein AidB-like acyl-CoA dehydrogenase
MSRRYIDMDDIRFLLFDVHHIDLLTQHPRFEHVGGREELEQLLQSAKDLADRELFPYYKEMDTHPVRHHDGHVRSHPQLKTIFGKVADAGWFSATTDLDEGGIQLPYTIFSTAHLIFEAANNSAQGYLGVSTGAIDLITSFGDQKLKSIFVPPMMEGRWQGTMALTEPQAGSSLSDIVTSARPKGEGIYHITGQKIFISAGEHEACENFIHLLLARIEGAPAGTKGISLFVVPKYLPGDDGTLGYNHVECVEDFQKMGQRGYATTHLVFGESGDTIGYLVGQPHNGLAYMFQMMNAARIAVGQTAAAIASAGYQYSLNYAKERPQGRRVTDKDPTQPQIPIIRHADVRRMLLAQKCFVEGSFSLVTECLKLLDLEKTLEGEAQQNVRWLLEFLTPIVKTYPAEEGIRSVSNALQIFGGYGYTMDFDIQQYYRDIRIMAIYEGTTGIQAIDLLGRKLAMGGGMAFKSLLSEIQQELEKAEAFPILHPFIERMRAGIKKWQDVASHLQSFAGKGQIEQYLSDANLFLEMSSLIVIGWQWIKIGVSICLSPSEARQFSESYYEGKLTSLRFFYKYEFPRINSLETTLMDKDTLTLPEGKEFLFD